MKAVLKKLIFLILTLFLVLVLTFVIFQLIPGDSALSKLSVTADTASVEALRENLGLNLSLSERFFTWFGGVLKGDFGTSLQYGMPVKELLAERFPVTIWLAALSILITVLVSFPLGILAARKPKGVADRIIFYTTQIFMAIPPFFLGILLTLIFGILLKFFIPGAYVDYRENFGAFLGYLIYPAIAIAIPKVAMVVKLLRSSVLRELGKNYVRTARSKGNHKKKILFSHVLKNAILPVITFLGMIIADVLAGSIIIEQVFNLPGIGRMLVVAISNRDFMVVQAIVFYITVVVLLCNAIVDLLYHKIDPRVKG